MYLKKKMYYVIATMLVFNQATVCLYPSLHADPRAMALELYKMIDNPTENVNNILTRIQLIKNKDNAYKKRLFLTSPYDNTQTQSSLKEVADESFFGSRMSDYVKRHEEERVAKEVLSESLFEDILVHAKRNKTELLTIAEVLWNAAPDVALNLKIDKIPLSLDLFRKITDDNTFKNFYNFLLQNHPDALRKKTNDHKNIFHIITDPNEPILRTDPMRLCRMQWTAEKQAPLEKQIINALINEPNGQGYTPWHLLLTESAKKAFPQRSIDKLTKELLQCGASPSPLPENPIPLPPQEEESNDTEDIDESPNSFLPKASPTSSRQQLADKDNYGRLIVGGIALALTVGMLSLWLKKKTKQKSNPYEKGVDENKKIPLAKQGSL